MEKIDWIREYDEVSLVFRFLCCCEGMRPATW